MATEFLVSRHKTFFTEVGGERTVGYIPFSPSGNGVNALTKEVTDEAAAYDSTPRNLPALVVFNPSKAIREKLGAEIDFEAVLRLASRHLDDNQITLTLGDAFQLPDGQRYYATKIAMNIQNGSTYIEWLVAVSRKVGRRG